MPGNGKLRAIDQTRFEMFIHRGPILSELDCQRVRLESYVGAGGYEVARKVFARSTPREVRQRLESAGLRGRAGGGFPTGHKLEIVARESAQERFLVCNAHSAQPGGFKERYLVRANPHGVIESVAIAALGARAKTAIIFLGKGSRYEEQLLSQAVEELEAADLLGGNAFNSKRRLKILIFRSPGGYITGEETALLELLEGRPGLPRRKPPVPANRGLFGRPTAVINLETAVQAFYIIKHGAKAFRRYGTKHSPGTLIFSLSGGVRRPGLYELPLGTSLRSLILEYGNGVIGERNLKAVLPGGISSGVIGGNALDVSLDYDGLWDIGSDLGSGVVIVVPEGVPTLDLAISLQRFYHDSSCGKCQPCKEGTGRVLQMLESIHKNGFVAADGSPPIERVDEGENDTRSGRMKSRLPVLLERERVGAVRYADSEEGLGKISVLCEFYKYRGDCHHVTESAVSIQRFIELFREELERTLVGSSECSGTGKKWKAISRPRRA